MQRHILYLSINKITRKIKIPVKNFPLSKLETGTKNGTKGSKRRVVSIPGNIKACAIEQNQKPWIVNKPHYKQVPNHHTMYRTSLELYQTNWLP